MSYVMIEDEHAMLHGLVKQFGFLEALLTKTNLVTMNAEELLCMLMALRAPVESVMKAVSGRWKGAGGDEEMGALEWGNLAKMLSGRGLFQYRQIVDMDERLALMVQGNPEMQYLFDAWRAAMTDDGALPMVGRDSTHLEHYAGLVRPLVMEKFEPIDAYDVARLYNVEDPAAVAQAIADLTNRVAMAPRETSRKAPRKAMPKAPPKPAKPKARAAAR